MSDTCSLYPLETLKGILEGLPQYNELGLDTVTMERGRCALRMPYDERLIGNPDNGILHGGAVTTLLDSVGGMVVFTAIPEGASVATLDLRIDYLKPATPGRVVIGEAEVYKLTQSVAFVRGAAFHEDEPEEPIAHAFGSFMVGSVGFSPTTKEEGGA